MVEVKARLPRKHEKDDRGSLSLVCSWLSAGSWRGRVFCDRALADLGPAGLPFRSTAALNKRGES